ncbi:AbgT family transporter [Ruminococcaceae bacterium OttesenSCG-928-D13]|nr:AbgT family transporter [Ruminococcaceae bacterium OttesenSCG-928-D13]
MASEKQNQPKAGLNISAKTFVSTVLLLLAIMILAGVLTQVIPQGSFEYETMDGRSVVVPGTYAENPGAAKLPIWRWFTAPFEVLATSKAVTAGMIMLFILLIGGSFLVLEQSGILSHMIFTVIGRFEGKKYQLLAIITFVCMLLGSTMGLFEETVTLVPITVALALMLGWDSLTGIGMSILAVGFGFSAGTLNPFTIGVAQNLADLPMFSGLLLRLVFFAVTYCMLLAFLVRYAKRVEKHPEKSLMHEADAAARQRYQNELAGAGEKDPAKQKALGVFVAALCMVFAYVIVGLFVAGLSDYAMPVMAVCFTAGALVAGRMAGLKKGLFKTFLKGMGSIAPSVLLILLAMSVTHIMETGNIIDTILYYFYDNMVGLGPYVGALALFGLVLLLNFFISGAAAKAFLLIPIIVPLADMIGVTRQTAIQAFALGDGFTNMLYPTNVVLLITLGMMGVPYGKWFRWTWKLQLALLAVSVAALLVAVAIGYGPY